MPTDLHTTGPAPPRWASRLMWFAALWLGGVGTVSAVAYVLRLWITHR